MRLLISVIYCNVALAQYVPEPYGWSCFRMAAKRNWPECTSVHRSKQKECLCQIPEFVVLTESCLNDAVANVTDTNLDHIKDIARRESLCAPPGADNSFTTGGRKSTLKNAQGYFDVPELGYVEPIDVEEINIALLTAEWRMTNDRRATRAGFILVFFWVFVLLVRYVASLVKQVTPESWLYYVMRRKCAKKLQARCLNSPLGRQRHCQPCLGFLGIRLPTRMFCILIALFAAANYTLIFTDYPYEASNFIYTTRTQQYNKSLAIRAAFMIMWKLPLLVCFAGRNNVFLLLKHPWPLDRFILLHKWISRITVVDIIIHSVAISLVKAEQGLYGVVWKVEYWQWGIVGTILISIIAIQSVHWINKRNYDTFVVIHDILVVVFLVSAWHHVYTLPYGKYHIVATCALWGFDRSIRIARIMVSGKVEANIRHYGTSVTIITVKAPRLFVNQKTHTTNTYAYLHIPCWYLFWQSHPFTIVRKGFKDLGIMNNESTDMVVSPQDCISTLSRVTTHNSDISEFTRMSPLEKQETELMISIKHRRGITRFISRLPEGPLNVVLDGPYGYSHPLHRFSKLILFAGGIGITPVLCYVKRVLELRHIDSDIQIHWAVTDLASMRWALKELTVISKTISITVYLGVQEQGSELTTEYERCFTFIFQRLMCINVLKSEVTIMNATAYELKCPSNLHKSSQVIIDNSDPFPRGKSHESLAIFSCGPDKLNDDARVAACWAIENVKVYADYYEESFSW